MLLEELRPDTSRAEQDLRELTEVLHATVHAGASVSFVLPFSLEDADAFWRRKVLPGVRSGSRFVLVARLEDEIIGTVQLVTDTPPNQSHRAEVAKLLVHPRARRQGIARALMVEIENLARRERRSLLTLDTRTGDSAERLYQSIGYTKAGVIPNYAWDPELRKQDPTTLFYKELTPA